MDDYSEKTDKTDTFFKNCEHSDGILQRLNELRNDNQLCDIILIAGECKFNAHRNVLSASSSYFLAMFNGYFPESNKKEIILNDVDPDCLGLILDYIYTSRLGVNHMNVQALLATACFLQIDWVRERCCDFMINALDSTNCLGIKKIGESQSISKLVDVTSVYLLMHFQDIAAKSEEFLSLSFDELYKILTEPELYIYDEEALLYNIVKWIDYNLSDRQQHLSKLVNQVHPACISQKAIKSIRILRDDKECRNWVDSVYQCLDKCQWNIFVLDKMGRKPDFGKFNVSTGNMKMLTPLPEEAFALSLTSHKHFLFVQGGSVGRSRRTCYYYNVYKNKWLNLPSMSEPRSHHRSLILDNFLYAIGGNGIKGSLRSAESLDLETGTTMTIEPMLSERTSMGAAVYEQCLCVMGGETDYKSLNSVECYDPRVGFWHSMPNLSVVNSYCTSAVVDNYIYCCEGLGSSMERFEMRSRKWETIEFTFDREFFELFSIGNDLYSTCSEEITRYYPSQNQWKNVYNYPFTREWDTAIGVELINDNDNIMFI